MLVLRQKCQRQPVAAREPEDVVDEMAQIVRDHQVGFINFYDDNFTLKRSRVVAICEEILRRNLQVEWKCEGRVDSVDVELLRLMRRAGCRCIAYGVESSHAPTLELLRKDIGIDQVHTAFHATQEAGLRSLAYMILGSPGETAQDVQRSVNFCRQIGADYVQFSTLTAMPGTPLFSQSHRSQAQGLSGPMDGDLSRETLTDLSPEELSNSFGKPGQGFICDPNPWHGWSVTHGAVARFRKPCFWEGRWATGWSPAALLMESQLKEPGLDLLDIAKLRVHQLQSLKESLRTIPIRILHQKSLPISL